MFAQSFGLDLSSPSRQIRRTEAQSRWTTRRTHRERCPSGVLSPSAFKIMAIQVSRSPCGHLPADSIWRRTKAMSYKQDKESALTSFQAHPSRPPAVDFMDTAASCSASPAQNGHSQESFLGEKAPHKVYKSLRSNHRVTLAPEAWHPCFTKVSINERRLD